MAAKYPMPMNLREYRRWLRKALNEVLDERYYESAASRLLSQTEQSVLWKQISDQLKVLDEKFYAGNNVYLLMHRAVPELAKKPFESMLLKSYRKNVLDNPNWAGPPDGGWIAPSNWFSTINDPIRTILIVKYLDGVPFAVAELRQLAEKAGIGMREDYEAREEGYYACHLYFTQQCTPKAVRG